MLGSAVGTLRGQLGRILSPKSFWAGPKRTQPMDRTPAGTSNIITVTAVASPQSHLPRATTSRGSRQCGSGSVS